MTEPIKQLVLVGGGGHCKSCIDVIEASGQWRIRGILDLPEKKGQSVCGYPVLGDEALITALAGEDCEFLVTIGQVESPQPRMRAFDRIKSAGAKLATVVSPTAVLARRMQLGEGSIIMHRALVNTDAVVGVNAIINSMALVEHDAQIGDHCHVSTTAAVNGNVWVGNRCFIGSNAVLAHGAFVPDDSFIRAGSLYKQRKN